MASNPRSHSSTRMKIKWTSSEHLQCWLISTKQVDWAHEHPPLVPQCDQVWNNLQQVPPPTLSNCIRSSSLCPWILMWDVDTSPEILGKWLCSQVTEHKELPHKLSSYPRRLQWMTTSLLLPTTSMTLPNASSCGTLMRPAVRRFTFLGSSTFLPPW